MPRYLIVMIATAWLTGCAGWGRQAPDYELLRQAEQAEARISDYNLATPAGDDLVVGVDVSDKAMGSAGSTKKFLLRELPVSDPVLAALGAKQNTVSAATVQEILDGTETAPRLISPAQLKTAAETHGGGGASYPGVTPDGADGLIVAGAIKVGTVNHGISRVNDDLTFVDPNNPLGVTLSQLLGSAAGLDWTVDQGAIDIHAGNIPDISDTYLLNPGAVANALYGWNSSGIPEAKTSVSVDIDLGLQSALVSGRMGRDGAHNITMGNGSATETFASNDNAATLSNKDLTGAGNVFPVALGIACSDEGSDLTAGTGKVTFRMPHAMMVTAVRASVNTAPAGATITVDVNEASASILSTKLTIDAAEKSSATAATAAVLSDTSLANDAEITIDIDQVGSTVAGKGLKIWIIGTRTLL